VRLIQYEVGDRNTPTLLTFEVPHTEQDHVGLQTLPALRDRALQSPVAITLTVPDHLAIPPEADRP